MKHVCSFLIFTLFSVNLYSQVSPSNERIVKQEVDKAVSCITASRDDSCTPKDRFGSAATLELLYSNDLIDKDTNAIVQGKLLYHKTGDNGVNTIWSSITLGVISNYVSLSEKERIYRSLKIAVANGSLPLAVRIGHAEGLGYAETPTVVQDISALLRKLATNMEMDSFDGSDPNGFVSLALFKSLGGIYERTGNYEAKDVLIQYSNTRVSIYPLTQTVWANIAAAQTNMGGHSITETSLDLKKIATWHEVKSVGKLKGVWAVPLDISRQAWSLIPQYIRDAEKIPYPDVKVLSLENALGWTAFSLNSLDTALRTILYVEMAVTGVTSILYGSEMAAVASPLANSVGEQIAARYGTELAYGLGVTTADTELATAFASTWAGKTVDKIITTAQKLGAKVDKIRILIRHRQNVSIKLDIPEEVKTSLTPYLPVKEGKATPDFKDATPEIINKMKPDPEFPKQKSINKPVAPKYDDPSPSDYDDFNGPGVGTATIKRPANIDTKRGIDVGTKILKTPKNTPISSVKPSTMSNITPTASLKIMPSLTGLMEIIPTSSLELDHDAPDMSPTHIIIISGQQYYPDTLYKNKWRKKDDINDDLYILDRKNDKMTLDTEERSMQRDLVEEFRNIGKEYGNRPLAILKIFEKTKFIPYKGTLGVVGPGNDFYEYIVPLLARNDIKVAVSQKEFLAPDLKVLINITRDQNLEPESIERIEEIFKEIMENNPDLIANSHIKTPEALLSAIKEQVIVYVADDKTLTPIDKQCDMMLFVYPCATPIKDYIDRNLKKSGVAWIVTEGLDRWTMGYVAIRGDFFGEFTYKFEHLDADYDLDRFFPNFQTMSPVGVGPHYNEFRGIDHGGSGYFAWKTDNKHIAIKNYPKDMIDQGREVTIDHQTYIEQDAGTFVKKEEISSVNPQTYKYANGNMNAVVKPTVTSRVLDNYYSGLIKRKIEQTDNTITIIEYHDKNPTRPDEYFQEKRMVLSYRVDKSGKFKLDDLIINPRQISEDHPDIVSTWLAFELKMDPNSDTYTLFSQLGDKYNVRNHRYFHNIPASIVQDLVDKWYANIESITAKEINEALNKILPDIEKNSVETWHDVIGGDNSRTWYINYNYTWKPKAEEPVNVKVTAQEKGGNPFSPLINKVRTLLKGEEAPSKPVSPSSLGSPKKITNRTSSGQAVSSSLIPNIPEWTHPDKLQWEESSGNRPDFPSPEENTGKVETSGLKTRVPNIKNDNDTEIFVGGEKYVLAENNPGFYVKQSDIDSGIVNPTTYQYLNEKMIKKTKKSDKTTKKKTEESNKPAEDTKEQLIKKTIKKGEISDKDNKLFRTFYNTYEGKEGLSELTKEKIQELFDEYKQSEKLLNEAIEKAGIGNKENKLFKTFYNKYDGSEDLSELSKEQIRDLFLEFKQNNLPSVEELMEKHGIKEEDIDLFRGFYINFEDPTAFFLMGTDKINELFAEFKKENESGGEVEAVKLTRVVDEKVDLNANLIADQKLKDFLESALISALGIQKGEQEFAQYKNLTEAIVLAVIKELCEQLYWEGLLSEDSEKLLSDNVVFNIIKDMLHAKNIDDMCLSLKEKMEEAGLNLQDPQYDIEEALNLFKEKYKFRFAIKK